MAQNKKKVVQKPAQTKGTLKEGEYHPAADYAKSFILSIPFNDLLRWAESFASVAMSGNRLAEVCSETLDRLMGAQPVSDRYLLGLAWIIRDGIEQSPILKGKGTRIKAFGTRKRKSNKKHHA